MTREEIIALALKHTVGGLEFDDDGLLAFFNEAYAAGAAAEREECAKVVEADLFPAAKTQYQLAYNEGVSRVAAAIRARKNK